MSCAIFTFIGVYVASANKSSQWTVNATFAAAVVCLFIGCFFAWRDKHNELLQTQAEKDAFRKRYEDNDPKLSLVTNSVEGPEAWREHPHPVAFTVEHLSGRVPTSLSFDPIPSKKGRFLLQLDPLSHVRAGGIEGTGFEIIEVGKPTLSAANRETIKNENIHTDLLRMFLDDSPLELLELDYTLNVQFTDGDTRRTQAFDLVFDKTRFRLLCNPKGHKLLSASSTQVPGLPTALEKYPETDTDSGDY